MDLAGNIVLGTTARYWLTVSFEQGEQHQADHPHSPSEAGGGGVRDSPGTKKKSSPAKRRRR